MVHNGFAQEARVEVLFVVILFCVISLVRFPPSATFYPPRPGGPARSDVAVRGLSASGPLIDRLLNCSLQKRLLQCA